MTMTRSKAKMSSRIAKLGVLSCVVLTLIGAASGSATAPGVSEPLSGGGPATLRRLNEEQYKRSIAQIFGADIKVPGRFEPPVREDGLLAVGDSKVIVTPAGFEQYAIRSREIATNVLDDTHRSKLLDCGQSAGATFDNACANSFLGKYGRLLFRRPLTQGELASVTDVARRATQSTASFTKGLQSGLAALLVSPSFVFRIETAEQDPGRPGTLRLNSYSLASRISFLLWNSPPDEELLSAAADGSLQTQAGLERQVDRLLASPQLESGVRAFFSDMFAFDQFAGLSKDNALFPIFNPRLRDDAQEQTLRTVVDHLLVQKADYRDLLTTKKTFLSRSLGALYGVKVDYRGFGGWMPYTFPADSPHAGILTLPAFLMLDPSHEGRSSPTIRGKSVRENFLCETVPSPPANVNFSLVQDVNDPVRKTARERLTAHQDNPVCAGCHKITDPIGLSLENYTPVGAFRAQENGVSIDASGKFAGKPYKNAIELMSLLRESPSAPTCVVQRTYEYGVGRKIAAAEEPWLEYADARFATDGYRYPALLRMIAVSPAFHAVAPANVAVNFK